MTLQINVVTWAQEMAKKATLNAFTIQSGKWFALSGYFDMRENVFNTVTQESLMLEGSHERALLESGLCQRRVLDRTCWFVACFSREAMTVSLFHLLL